MELVVIIGRSTRAAHSTHGVIRIKSDICLTASTMQQEGSGAPNENIVQNYLNIAFLNVF